VSNRDAESKILDLEIPLPPCNFVIFGATGNLESNKLLPALYRLEMAGKLPEGVNFIVSFPKMRTD
jgi:glucose-6-phosphate 1-dehydrogenase